VVKRARGYTLMEMVVTLAVFGMLLMIVTILTAEMRANEKRYPINYLAHPEVGSIMARMRKDIFDTTYYPAEWQGYQQTPRTLILYTLRQTGFAETVVWDFRATGEVHRKVFNATEMTGDWVARGVPEFRISSFTLDTGQDAVRVTATDEQNRLAIDTIILPRPHD
jgi:prepilin-type N-terminal cleavage/methylation domain-containing protein